jgi:hypothetical protein
MLQALTYREKPMYSTETKTPQQECESVLLAAKRYNIEHDILPSEIAITDRLLARKNELKDAFEELHVKLGTRPRALHGFLDLLLGTTALWNPEKIRLSRTLRSELTNVNQQIAARAAELSHLLARRSDLQNTSSFASGTHHHVCDVIEAASEGNRLFKSHVHPKLDALTAQYDLKYWPTLSAFAREISEDAEQARINATDPLTAAATSAIRPSLTDFFKALFAAMEENSAKNYGPLPTNFKLTDRTLASLTNCALDLGPDDLIDDAYVKQLRQRIRNQTQR